MSANSQSLGGVVGDMADAMVVEPSSLCERISVRVTTRIEDVEAVWRDLTAASIESPGQSYDFIRLWVRNRNIPASRQRYVLAELDGRAIAILPLHLKRVWGVRVLTWFPGSNAGCYAPVADYARLAALGVAGRSELWRAMTSDFRGAELLFLRSIPAEVDGQAGLFDELGSWLQHETLHRAEFGSWAQCDAEQRSRSRRKHDRQQGDRLAALGEVTFEDITDPALAGPVMDTMFRQRSERFRSQGIRDCFVEDDLIGFYHAAMAPGSGIDVRLHALCVDGAVVAVRYNIVHGERMFCLISSMSDCPRMQGGSPGKQCLLRVMQSVFDSGIRVFDMGSGFTDEKRHWCNVQVPLRHHHVGLSPLGTLVIAAHRGFQQVRMWAKASPSVKKALRGFQQVRDRLGGNARSDQL